MRSTSSDSYITSDELQFLHSVAQGHIQCRRLDSRAWSLRVLRGYIDAAEFRTDWGEINPSVTVPYAKALLERMEGGND